MSHSPAAPAPDESASDAHADHVDAECFSLCEYDLHVVDDALKNPTRGEYLDHFGFHIQVKTDDEGEGISSSESDQSDQEDGNSGGGSKSPSANRRPRRLQPTHSITTSSEEDDASVDTAMTTPTMVKHPFPLPSSAVPDMSHRCRASTVAESPQEQVEEESEQQQQHGNNDSESITLSRGRTQQGGSVVVRQKPLPPRPLDDEPEAETGGGNSGRTRSESGKSFHSFSFFKRTDSVSSRSSNNSHGSSATAPSRPLERPSQAFQERQSKRMSGLIRGTQPPAASAAVAASNSKRFSYAAGSGNSSAGSGSSYYGMIRSKLGQGGGRHSEDQQRPHSVIPESARHLALKEEAKACLDQQASLSDSDRDFWAAFIHDTDHVTRTQADSVREHMVAGGIPLSVRGQLWQIMAKSRNLCDLESEYRELIKRVSPHDKAMQRDVARSFPATAFFQHPVDEGAASVLHVVKAYSLFDQQVGYNKQLFYLVACFVSNMPDEHAFAVLAKLMSQYSLRQQFTTQQPPDLLDERLYQFNHLLQQMLPAVHQHLAKQHVQPSMYASQWFLTLFAYRAPMHLACRVLDVVLVEGTQMMLRFALTLMFRSQHTIVELDDFEGLIHFLNNAIYDDYKDDVNGFIQDAYHLDIAPKLLTRLSKQYAADAAREAKTQTQEEQLRSINADLTGQLRRLEKSYQSLEKDHHDVASQVIDAKMNVARMDDENGQLRRQLTQTRNDLEKGRVTAPVVDNLMRENAHLKQQNAQLTARMNDLEAMLVSLKIKHAETESAYDDIQQKLYQTCGQI